MSERITPEHVEKTTFNTQLRGYRPSEVDAFLRKVAGELREAQRLLSDKLYQSLGAEIGSLLQQAKEAADSMTDQAEADSARIRSEAEAEAKESRATVESDAERTRAEADRDTAATRKVAEEDATDRIRRAEAKVSELNETEAELRRKLSLLRVDLETVTEQLRHLETPIEEGDEVRLDKKAESRISRERETISEPQKAPARPV